MSSSSPSISAAAGYTLKFISGKYQGGEFPLKLDKQVVIGRSGDLDMVLVEDMVSRKHARIWHADGLIHIEDLGSTNGTFVNGEKIKQSHLNEGDRILIGTSILKLVVVGTSEFELDEQAAKAKMEEVAARAAKSSKPSSMTGRIEEVPLPDLLQLFHTSKKNGVLLIEGPEEEGRVYLRQGRVFYAVMGDRHDLGPQKSFNRIVTWTSGAFELQALDEQSFLVELDSSTEGLLMEAMRQFDELARLEGQLPARQAPLRLSKPLSAPLRSLSAEQLDTLQLVLNHGSLQGAMDHSDKDDLLIAENVLELVRKQYLIA